MEQITTCSSLFSKCTNIQESPQDSFISESLQSTEHLIKYEFIATLCNFIVGILISFRFFFIFHVTDLIVNSRIIVFCYCKAHESIFLCIVRYNKIIITSSNHRLESAGLNAREQLLFIGNREDGNA